MKHTVIASLLTALIVALSVPVLAASLDLANDPATGGPGEFAVEEIRREAEACGMTLGDDANATRIELTVGKEGNDAAQSYSIRVQNEGGRRVIAVRGADATGAMYGGLEIDLKWYPEACLSHPRSKGFYTVRHFTEGSSMPGAEVLCICDWRARLVARKPMEQTTPLEIAAALDGAVAETMASLDALREAAKEDSELGKTVTDCEALACLGRYYASKIRGACALALFDANGDKLEHEAALRHLGDALTHWKQYAAIRDTHYVPALYTVSAPDSPMLCFALSKLEGAIQRQAGTLKRTTNQTPDQGAEIMVTVDPATMTDIGADGFRRVSSPQGLRITGGDERGAMYGVLDVAEQIRMGTPWNKIQDRTVTENTGRTRKGLRPQAMNDAPSKRLRLCSMKTRHLPLLALLFCAILPVNRVLAEDEQHSRSIGTSVQNGWVTVVPPEFQGAIDNPLEGFRDYKKDGYGLLKRQYIKWNDIEVSADDSVERIIAHTNKITETKGKCFEDLNVKLVPRVYLDWNGSSGRQHWPADLHTFDYDSPAFQERLRRLVAKLGEAWDEDPRIFAVQMGLIGHFGEHHNPAPTAEQRRLLTEAFQNAFKNKPVLVRHTDPEFMEAGFGIYYDTFANLSREPPGGPKDQFPWQATYVYPDIWKRAPIEGEVEYNWQQQRESAKPAETFGRTPDETMNVPAYRRFMMDKIRRYHASYLGWIDNYDESDREVLAGAAELQKAFGYRFVLDSVSYPLAVPPGDRLTVKLSVRNTGSAPFYLDWPVAVALLDSTTKKPVWSAPLAGVDIRKWLPGEDWDSAAFAYRRPAVPHHDEGHATPPADIKPGQYIVAFAILDRQGGMLPSARFAIANYFRGGWHPLGSIGIGTAPAEAALENVDFDSPAFDDSLCYKVPEKLRAVKAPPLPQMKAVTPWTPDPNIELINPWRYWILKTSGHVLEKQILADGPDASRVIRVSGDFGEGASLSHNFANGARLDRGRYRFAFRVRGSPGQSVDFELADGWRRVSKEAQIPLTEQWQEHTLEFEVKTTFKDETTLRFSLPRDATGTFELADTRLRVAK